MRLGVNVPNFGPGTNPDTLRRWALTVEGLGFDLLMMSDHVAVTPDVAEQYPAPFSTRSTAITARRRIRRRPGTRWPRWLIAGTSTIHKTTIPNGAEVAHTEHADSGPGGVAPEDLPHLRRCVELAAEAVDAGDFPFGSVLVAGDGRILAEDRNRENTAGDATRHPEFELARWAAANMTAADRAAATVYTSGEHCPMCAAAHAWVGLGPIVYATSTRQLTRWLAELGVPPGAVRPMPLGEVAPGVVVRGPAPGLDEQVRELHRLFRSPRG